MLVKRFRLFCNPPTLLSLLVVLIMWGLVAYHSSGINMAANSLGSGIWLVLNLCVAVGGTYLLFGASRYVVQHCNRPSSVLVFLGMNSIPVIGFNYWINSISFQILGGILHWSALFAVELLALLALAYAIEKHGGKLGDAISGSWSPPFK
jgi:hypothetical protein